MWSPLAEVGVLVGQDVGLLVLPQPWRQVDAGAEQAEEAGGGEDLHNKYRPAAIFSVRTPPPAQVESEFPVHRRQEQHAQPDTRLPHHTQDVLHIHQPLQSGGIYRLLSLIPEGPGLLRAGDGEIGRASCRERV